MQNLTSVIKRVEEAEKRIMRILRVVFLITSGSALIHLVLWCQRLGP